MQSMSVAEFADYLSNRFDEYVVDIMKKNKISGSTFLKISEIQIEQMIPAVGDVIELRELQNDVISMEKEVWMIKTVCGYVCLFKKNTLNKSHLVFFLCQHVNSFLPV